MSPEPIMYPQPDTTIHPYKQHLHFNMLKQVKSRDFHKIALNIFNAIPVNEKSTYLHDFNSMIMTWHHQPYETWRSEYGIWARMEMYLNKHFPDTEKYKDIVEIFNHP